MRRFSETENSWFTEYSAALAPFLSFMAICVLLLHFNGSPVHTWHSITLNATVTSISCRMRKCKVRRCELVPALKLMVG
jgi:hypothetical protein